MEGGKSEVGVVIMDNNRNLFVLTYVIPLMYVGPLHKDLVTLTDTTSTERLLSGEYSLAVYVGDNLEGTLKII